MSFDNNAKFLPAIAGAAIARYLFVTRDGISADNELDPCSTNEKIVGVSPQYAVVTGEGFKYAVNGIHQITLGATVARGERVKSTVSGTATPIATTGSVLQNIGGQALQSGVSGDIVPIQIEISSERPVAT